MIQRLVILIICLIGFTSNAHSSQEKVTLQLSWDHQFQFAGYYAAKWQSYYKEAGILQNPITIEEFIFNPDRIRQIESEKIQAIIAIVGIILLACLLIIFLWTVILRKTVKKQTQELLAANLSLKKSEKQFRTMIAKSPLPMSISDNKHKIIFFNDKFSELFGYTLEDVSTTEAWWQMAYPDENYRAKVKELWREAKKKAEAKKTDIGMQEWSMTIKDRTQRICEFYMFPMEEFSLAIVNDITERKKQEIKLKRLALAIDNSSDTIVITDTSGNVNYVNPAFEKISGYSRNETHGKNLRLLQSDAHDPSFYEAMWKTISSGKTWSGRFINKRKDGSEYTEEATVSPVLSSEKKIVNYVAVKRDISEKLKLESQLRQAQKMESIGILAGGIAHDFNNILSAIIGFTDLALGDVENREELEDDLNEIHAAGKRAKDLIQQILTFARQSDEEMKPVQVDVIAKETLKLIRSSIPASVDIKSNIDSQSLVMGSASQIHQVFMNLCTNAAHAMENTGGVLGVSIQDITVDADSLILGNKLKDGRHMKISVSDTGQGIPETIIDSIFEPYFTTKAAGEGTGMGLAVVQGVVESHGGKITVDSIPGKGTTFNVYLPVVRKTAPDMSHNKEKTESGTGHILFVDDETPIVKMGSRVLEQLGYTVTTKTSSPEALELFRLNPAEFDLVISDVTMPEMNGNQLAVELMKIRPDIPVILCTGYSKKVSEEAALEMGVRAFIYKPLDRANLATAVRRTLDND